MKNYNPSALFSRLKKTKQFLTKVFFFLFCSTIFALNPNRIHSQDAVVRVEKKKAFSIEEIFDLIEVQTNYQFFYNYSSIQGAPKVELEPGFVKTRDVLNKALASSGLTYEFSDNIIILRKKTSSISRPLVQETFPISGVVTNSEGEPIPGATVFVTDYEPTQRNAVKDFIVRGATANLEGEFTIQGQIGHYIGVLAMGYNYEYRKIESEDQDFNFSLKESVDKLDEVLVVGYGTTRKRDLTGSVGSIDSEDIQQIQRQTIDQALMGKIAGVHVQSRGGQPGAGAFVHIRGLSQIRGDNQPLYVVDGVPIVTTPNTEALGLINYGESENPLLTINPNDIERIDVLKDASAAAIYGSRAANGVVIITTKRGKRNQAPRFSFNASTTIQNPIDTYDYLSASEYIDWATINAQAVLDEYPESFWPIYFPDQYAIVSDPGSFFGTADTDWQELIINENALWTEYNFNVSGGTQNVNYFTSFGVSDQDGVMIDNNFKRYTFSGNLDANVTENFKVGTSLNYNYSINKSNGFSGLSQYGGFRPDLPPYNEDGTFASYQGPYGEQYTALGDGKQTRNKAISKNLYGTIYGELQLFEDLRFKSQLNIGLNEDRSDIFNTSMSSNALFYGLYYARPGATLGVQTNRSWSTTFANTLNYNKIIGDHSIDAVVGVSWDRNRYDAEAQTYRGFPDDDVLVDINSASFFDEASSESLQQGLNSVFGRINYNYDDRYLATFTARRDGSTKFGPDNQYGFFPSGALAWNVHNEAFFNSEFINYLKIRASAGRVGSDNLPSFTYLAYYQSLENNDSFYDGINGIAVTGVPNTGIRWEETDQLDLAVEFGLLENRIQGEVIYYEKNTSGIILFFPIPSETGTLAWNTNIADVSNKGWEFTLGADIVRSNNFTWNSSLNLSTVTNKVDNLYGANAGNQSGVIEGEPIGVITGYDVIKIAQTQEEIDALNEAAGGVYQSSLTQPGDYIFRDISGDGVVTTEDRGPIGDPTPDFFGGWNNHATFRNWSFTMNWNFVQGIDRQYQPISNLYYIDVLSNQTTLIYDAWSPDNTDAPYARHGSPTNGYTATSRSVVDASYIRLRSASIGYNLPRTWFDNLGVTNTRLSLSGNNLITITDYPGLDPEDVRSFGFAGRTTNFNMDEGMSYPNTRSFTLSLNITM